MTLCQKAEVTGAIVVSTPQDVALLDARKALNMFELLKTPVLGLIENMASYVCPNCGHEAHIFGEGGVKAEAERLDLPFLGALPDQHRDPGSRATPGSPSQPARGRCRTALCCAGTAIHPRWHGLRRVPHGVIRAPDSPRRKAGKMPG